MIPRVLDCPDYLVTCVVHLHDDQICYVGGWGRRRSGRHLDGHGRSGRDGRPGAQVDETQGDLSGLKDRGMESLVRAGRNRFPRSIVDRPLRRDSRDRVSGVVAYDDWDRFASTRYWQGERRLGDYGYLSRCSRGVCRRSVSREELGSCRLGDGRAELGALEAAPDCPASPVDVEPPQQARTNAARRSTVSRTPCLTYPIQRTDSNVGQPAWTHERRARSLASANSRRH